MSCSILNGFVEIRLTKTSICQTRLRHGLNTMEGNTDWCPLLGLPAELRIKIYEYTLIEDEPIYLNRRDSFSKQAARPVVGEPALLAVNHQLRNEAAGVYYGAHYFISRYEDDTRSFFDRLSKTERSMVRNFEPRHFLDYEFTKKEDYEVRCFWAADFHSFHLTHLMLKFRWAGLRKDAIVLPATESGPSKKISELEGGRFVDDGEFWQFEWRS